MNNLDKYSKVYKSPLFIVIALCLVSSYVAILALRANYTKMTELREAVYTADASGEDVEAPLLALREHVHSHMNTDLARGTNAIRPPIQLKGRYERLMAAEAEEIKQTNANVAAEGERLCAASFPGGGFNSARVACVTDYVAANAVSESAVADDLYKFDFVSPRWSPDLAGWSLVVAFISGVVAVLIIVKKILYRHR